jgi:predicted AAA+ superfamily ATPase
MATQRRFFDPPDGSFFLLGPRGTGKTTLLKSAMPNALVVNLLDAQTYRTLVARPERLWELVRGEASTRDVVVDEIQRIPELLHVVHDLIESGPPKRYVLTGSSARKLRRGGVDLLAGRAVMRTLHPFMAAEWPSFALDESLRSGLVPLVADSANPADTLRTYVGLYLEQEVQAEGLARNIGQFSRFLEAVSFSHASVVSVSAIARDAEVSRKTTEGFISVLEDLLIAHRVPVFTRRAKRATAAHPKLYLFDAGVFRVLRRAGPLDRPEEIEGAALEGLVAQHLRAWIAYSGSELALHTWRTRSGVEVDFVLYGPDGFWAIEVKNTARVRPEDLRSLRAFQDDYPEAKPLLLHRGERRIVTGGVPCVPVESFLASLNPGRDLA